MNFISFLKSNLIFYIMLLTSIIFLICGGIYAFLSGEVAKVDVSDSVIVPENYENLLVFDITINQSPNIRKDIFLHNSQAGSSSGNSLSSFLSTDWYSDHNGNLKFDGNQISSDNEATIYSADNILDPTDIIKNTGFALIKPFRYSNGVYEQYIDDNHSNNYTPNEAVIRTSTTDGIIKQNEVVRSGSADMTIFPSYVRFTDGIQGTLSPANYQNGEAIIIDVDPINILSNSDTILISGNADLKSFLNDVFYSDINVDRKYSNNEAVIIDKGIIGKLDPDDIIANSGDASLSMFNANEKYSDNNNNDIFDSDELLIKDTLNDMMVQPVDIKISGFANLRSLDGEGLFFSDNNNNSVFNTDELVIRDSGNTDILSLSDDIVRNGKADLKSFITGTERFIDDNNNGIYDDGECIVNNSDGIIKPSDVEKNGKALLKHFSGNGYLFTDFDNNTKYTGDINLADGYNGEAIFKDLNNNGLLDNGELVRSGYAPIKAFLAPLRFIDINGNNIFDDEEPAITSNDSKLSIDDKVIISGRAFLSTFPQGIIKWAEVNNNDKYDDNELIISSVDNILSSGEVIKPGLCGLQPFPVQYNNYKYSDNNNNNGYSSDEVVVASSDYKLDPSDSVIKSGKANLLRFLDTKLLFIDENKNNEFSQNEPIVYNNDLSSDLVLLDSSDVVVKNGSANIKSFNDEITYIDTNNDSLYQGDADGDVIWNKGGNPIDPNDPDIIADQDEVLLKDPIGAKHLALDDGDIVLRPGMASIKNFSDSDKYIDHYNLGEFSGSNDNEAIIRDNDGILDNTDSVTVTGKALITSFSNEKYIDDNNDTKYTQNEVIWRDSGSVSDRLDPDDEIIKSGYAMLLSLKGYKYTSDGTNPNFTGAQAIIIDNSPENILGKNDVQIKTGTADVRNFTASEKFMDCDGNLKYDDGEPILNSSGNVINPGTLVNFPANTRFIDSDNSGYYSASGSPLTKTLSEAIIADNGDMELNAGALDGTGTDKVLVSGKAKIKPIGEFSAKLNPPNPNINAFLDKNLNDTLDDYEVLIKDNAPIGILDSSDIVYGKILAIGDTYDWSDSTIVSINGSSLNPSNPSINAYIDSYNIGFLDNYEILIRDNAPLGILGSNDVVIGEIKNKDSLTWSATLEEGIPWRQLMKGFVSQEKFLTSKAILTYQGQPIINEITGTKPNVWDSSDLIVYDGTPPIGISNNWGLVKYIDDNHSDSYNYDSETSIGECIIDFSLVPFGSDPIYPDIIITEGKAGFAPFQSEYKFCDYVRNGIYNIEEALINDINDNNMIDAGEVVSAGVVGNRVLESPLFFIDSNHNGIFNPPEAVINDGNLNALLDAGLLDGSGIDKVISSGQGGLTKFKRSEKFVDGNGNNAYDSGEAIIYDWFKSATYEGEFILTGDHINKTGSLSYLAPGARDRDCIILPSEIGKANIIEINDRPDQKYIDYNNSNSYNGFYDVWNGIDYEPIISSANDQIDKGNLDGRGTDRIISSGYCLRLFESEIKWTDSNHDSIYQDNEAIVYDSFDDNIIANIGLGAGDDRIIVSGDASLKAFINMKYVDANNNNDIDNDELLVKDSNNDDIVENDEICQSGLIPFLKPFTETDYRYCDWDNDGNYDPQEESIIYTPIKPDVLDKDDEIVASGSYPALKSFSSQANFIDFIQNNSHDDNEAIIVGDGNQIFDGSDQIIVHGLGTSFDNTNVKYSALNALSSYADDRLIADSDDDVLEGNEILTSGKANIVDFNPNVDFYADNNHNGRYDFKVYNSKYGEAIISDTTGNKNIVEYGEIKTEGYAGLMTFDGTAFKYADSGARDQKYNDNELLINDLNNDNKVGPQEIIFPGFADLKSFTANVKYCDSNHDSQYDSNEAIVLSDDYILQNSDTILGNGEANLRNFEANLYRFTDSNHDGIYSGGEAIIVESEWKTADDILEESDIIIFEGTADIEQFPSNIKFLDDLSNSGEYEDGEAVVNDSNSNGILDITDEIIKTGRASIKRFSSSERYIDGGSNSGNSLYDSDEPIIRDGNSDGKLSSGPLDGTGTDAVLVSGKAKMERFNNNEMFVDKNNNGQYDGNEDIYQDEDNNKIVTGDESDQLIYFVIENIGTATNQDIASVKLWADRDGDNQFEPLTDDAPVIKSLLSDTNNPKLWYEGPANSPPLSFGSSRQSIGYTLSYPSQRFFVSANIGNSPTDGRDIQMRIPINGIKRLYSLSGPSDAPVTNAYNQIIDFSNPIAVSITSPQENDMIYGQVILKAEANDSIQIGKVEFYDGKPDGIKQPIAIDDNGPPWEAVWDCSNAGYGNHVLYARGYDKTYIRPPKARRLPHYLDSQGVNVGIGLSYSIQLASGWNYVSFPLEPFNTDVLSIMPLLGSDARSIWAYEAIGDEWLRYDLDGPGFLNNLESIHAGIGYQIYMANSRSIYITGTMPQNSIPLKDGWNLVGWNSNNPMNTADALSSIMANNPSIWTVNPLNGEWLGYDPADATNDLLIIEPGKAYWIKVSSDCIWYMNP